MNAAAFLTASPLGYSGVVKSARVCERSVARRHTVPVARAAIATTGSAGSAGPSYMDDSNDNDDGGDGFFGDPGDLRSSMGIPMPPMSREERDWFLDAPDEKLRLERLKIIAKRRHNEQIMAQMKAKIAFGDIYRANSAESYMDSLARQSAENEAKRLEDLGLTPPKPKDAAASPPPTPAPQRLSTIDFHQAKRVGMNAGERYMDDLRTGTTEAAKKPEDKATSPTQSTASSHIGAPSSEVTTPKPSVPVPPPSPTSVTPTSATPTSPPKVDPVPSKPSSSQSSARPRNVFLNRDAAGKKPTPPSEKPPAAEPVSKSPPLEVPADSSTLDKQIAFLEQHLSKLQKEDAKESGTPVKEDRPDPMQSKVKDLTKDIGKPSSSVLGGMGKLSPEETRNVFEQISQARGDGAAAPADPLAAPLPERRAPGTPFDDISLGDGPAEMTEDQIKVKFDEVRQQNRESIPGVPVPAMPAPSAPMATPAPSAPPAAAGAAADPVRSALMALDQEHRKYIDASRRTLNAYERNLNEIIARHLPE